MLCRYSRVNSKGGASCNQPLQYCSELASVSRACQRAVFAGFTCLSDAGNLHMSASKFSQHCWNLWHLAGKQRTCAAATLRMQCLTEASSTTDPTPKYHNPSTCMYLCERGFIHSMIYHIWSPLSCSPFGRAQQTTANQATPAACAKHPKTY